MAATGANVGNFFAERAVGEAGVLKNASLPAGNIQDDIDTLFPLPTTLPSENSCLFGPLLLNPKRKRGISQKSLARHMSFHLGNMHRIEAGRQEPGIMTALAMLKAVDADIERFFN